MHYRNGVEAKVGDLVAGVTYEGQPVSGVVIKTHPEPGGCSLVVQPIANPVYIDTANAVLITDALKAPEPEAKPEAE